MAEYDGFTFGQLVRLIVDQRQKLDLAESALALISCTNDHDIDQIKRLAQFTLDTLTKDRKDVVHRKIPPEKDGA